MRHGGPALWRAVMRSLRRSSDYERASTGRRNNVGISLLKTMGHENDHPVMWSLLAGLVGSKEIVHLAASPSGVTTRTVLVRSPSSCFMKLRIISTKIVTQLLRLIFLRAAAERRRRLAHQRTPFQEQRSS
jgi:hypothetical protein